MMEVPIEVFKEKQNVVSEAKRGNVSVEVFDEDLSVDIVSEKAMEDVLGYNFRFGVAAISHAGSSLDESESYIVAVNENVAGASKYGAELMGGYAGLGYVHLPRVFEDEDGLENAIMKHDTLLKALNWELNRIEKIPAYFEVLRYLGARDAHFMDLTHFFETMNVTRPYIAHVKECEKVIRQNLHNTIKHIDNYTSF